MTKVEIIELYIGDLRSKVPQSEARDNRINMLIEESNKALNMHIVMDWVACKDKLPTDETKNYLVLRDGEITIETWYYRNDKGFWYNYLGITHFAELPKPPCA